MELQIPNDIQVLIEEFIDKRVTPAIIFNWGSRRDFSWGIRMYFTSKCHWYVEYLIYQISPHRHNTPPYFKQIEAGVILQYSCRLRSRH